MKPDYSNLRDKTPLDFMSIGEIIDITGYTYDELEKTELTKLINNTTITLEERADYFLEFAYLIDENELYEAAVEQFKDIFNTPELKIAKRFARENGWFSASPTTRSQKKRVNFKPLFVAESKPIEDGDAVPCIGLPQYIIVEKRNPRFIDID